MDLTTAAQLMGNFGEFIGAIAVLITLVYLAVQVKYSKTLLEENRRIALGQISQTNTGFRLELQRYLGQPHIAELRSRIEQGEARYHDGQVANFKALDPVEQAQWRCIAAQFAIMTDEGIYQSSLGLMGQQDSATFERQALSSMPYWQLFENYVPTRLRNWYENRVDD